ncbi:MAG: alpha-galactosidase, partial [Verrucomicrobiae bacterium]|nr:alpha-galactosidase [Verrucomicrobiae bacterium]
MRILPPFLVLLGTTFLALPAAGVSPQPDELAAGRRLADEVLGLTEPAATTRAGLELLQEDVADSVTRGRSWRGTPYQIGDRAYAHGLAFNSVKRIRVRAGQPADRFTADVGLENNDDTRRGATLGNGSVTFHVLVAGVEICTSPVLRLDDGPRSIDVPLNGAMEFEIRVGDGGDGRGWDQALWGEATIWLRDGTKLRLQDLPWLDVAGANPFGLSFLFGGRPSSEFLPGWTCERSEPKVGETSTERRVTYHDPTTGLEVRVEVEQYPDQPAVEWVVQFTNQGTADTPILESIQALDSVLPLAGNGTCTLHWAKGAVASFDDFAPETTVLKPGAGLRLQPGGGRSSSQVMPFFNLEGSQGGVVLAVGWTGEWAAGFRADSHGQPAVKAGMDRTRLKLHPGETIRTPRMLMLCYEGDRWRGQNLLRQFLLKHHRPQRNGEPLVAPITCGNWGGTSAEVHLDNIRQIIEHDLPVEYYWIDAEWYGRGGWPVNVGDWRVKQDLYPNGFKPLSDALRKSGRELMLWFEPERVHRGTPWHREHPDWLLDRGGDSLLLNLGNPAARQFLTDFISARVDEFGLGCYRQDFNIDPLEFWRQNDEPDRQGITEIRYIEGLYRFWDELRARHPSLIIDNCASGGRRLDLETLGRATPFWRTDGPRDAIAHQCHTYGLLPWVPLSSTSEDRAPDDYEFRSSMCSALCLNWWVSGDVPAAPIRTDFPFDWAKRTLEQYLSIRPYYYGDYYPLTAWSKDRDLWLAYQLDRPDLDGGLVVGLRRPDSPYESARFPLRGLDPEATYQLTDLDTGGEWTLTGAALVKHGLEVVVRDRPGST